MELLRTTNKHVDFIRLTAELDRELNARYGKDQAAYDQHNQIDPIDTAILVYVNNSPVACGCFKAVGSQAVEIKRMFVQKDSRRRGAAKKILNALETWAAELGYSTARLETGRGQPEAIALYRANGYQVIENYGPYIGMENSICMQKNI